MNKKECEEHKHKIRAWDKKYNVMVELCIDSINELTWSGNYKKDGDYSGLMQFTGLHDKNGKEVFEGDVLKDDKGQFGQVLWAHNSWLIEWDERDYQGHRIYNTMTDDCFGYGEVVGNVFENPELIK